MRKDYQTGPERLKMYVPNHGNMLKYYSEMKAAVPEKDFGNNAYEKPKRVNVKDARRLQMTYESPAVFYKEFGFCLLEHETSVTDWDTDENFPKSSEITTKYH